MFEQIKSDLDVYAYRRGLPSGFLVLVPLFNMTTWPIIQYRMHHWVHNRIHLPVLRHFFLIFCNILKMIVVAVTGVTISERATIGKGFYIAHLTNIVISHNSVIGQYASIHQGVTLGGAGRGEKYGGPTLGDCVYVAAGAKIIGNIYVGNHALVSCNAVVTKNVPDNATVGGIPAKILNMEGSHGWVHFRPGI